MKNSEDTFIHDLSILSSVSENRPALGEKVQLGEILPLSGPWARSWSAISAIVSSFVFASAAAVWLAGGPGWVLRSEENSEARTAFPTACWLVK